MIMTSKKSILTVALTALSLLLAGTYALPARAEVRLPNLFSSHMVLQQEKPLVVWGWAQPN